MIGVGLWEWVYLPYGLSSIVVEYLVVWSWSRGCDWFHAMITKNKNKNGMIVGESFVQKNHTIAATLIAFDFMIGTLRNYICD